MKKLLKTMGDVADDVLAYVLTVVGILFSNALPLLKTNEPFSLDMGVWRIGAAMVVALVFIGHQEKITPDDEGSKARSREGRRKNFKIRMVNALAQGVLWSTITNNLPV